MGDADAWTPEPSLSAMLTAILDEVGVPNHEAAACALTENYGDRNAGSGEPAAWRRMRGSGRGSV